MPSRRRPLVMPSLLLSAALGASGGASAQTAVQVWVDLSAPVGSAGVAAQQQAVAAQLQRLGATELGRVRHTGNAIAVRIDAARLNEVRALDGVRGVRPAVKRHPPKTTV